MNRAVIIQGPFSGGRVPEEEFEPDVAKVYETQVNADLATGEIAMTAGGATVNTKLDPIPEAISYVGIGAASAAVDFSRVEVSAR